MSRVFATFLNRALTRGRGLPPGVRDPQRVLGDRSRPPAARAAHPRPPTSRERGLLAHLFARAGLDVASVDALLVADMDDGGMGSLTLFPGGVAVDGRRLGSTPADYRFLDEDGVDVLVTLILDEDGNPFELDSWKVDFSPLIRLPDVPLT